MCLTTQKEATMFKIILATALAVSVLGLWAGTPSPADAQQYFGTYFAPFPNGYYQYYGYSQPYLSSPYYYGGAYYTPYQSYYTPYTPYGGYNYYPSYRWIR